MSWLEDSALADKKLKLKPTTTRVTTCNGVQYTEQRADVDINRKSCGRPNNLVLSPTTSHPGYIVDNKPDLNIGVVTDNLLIGSIDAASDRELLQKYRVSHILSVAPLLNYQVPIEAEHLSLDILDLPETNLNQYYDAAFTFIRKAVEVNGCVLIHCNAGVSRSAAITIAYLMQSRTLSYDSAWAIVKEKRPAINPNIGFIFQLKHLEQELFDNREK